MLKLDSFADAVKTLGQGGMLVLVDDADREDEADLIVAAERITSEHLAFMFNHGRTVVCLTLTQAKLKELGLPMQVAENGSPLGPNFAVSFDHRSVVASGVTAEGRAKTIREAIKEPSDSSEFVRPGFVFPIGALPGGVLSRRGHTEGSVDLARLAGCLPAAVICEVMGEDGTMLRGQGVRDFCDTHKLPLISIAQLVKYRSQNEMSVRRLSELPLESIASFTRREDLATLFAGVAEKTRVLVYIDDVDRREHFAIVCGEPRENALVRVHSECLTGDVFGSRRCDCGYQLSESLRQIFTAGEGVLVYLHQEGRGIGLANKLRAYELQDQGRDTVQANLELGFEVDSRSYRAAAHMLGDLGVTSVRLMTNNPEKIQSLEEFGIPVRERVGIEAPIDDYNRGYLEVKRAKLGHLLASLFLICCFATQNFAFALVAAPEPVEELSLLQPIGKDCGWYRYNLRDRKKELLSRFPGSCVGGSVSWSNDVSLALVWFSQRGTESESYSSEGVEAGTGPKDVTEEVSPRFYLVNISRKENHPLPMPPSQARLEDLGFDALNRPTALFLQEMPESEVRSGVIRFEGKEYPLSGSVGQSAIAFAMSWLEKEKKWVRTEVSATDTGACDTRGVGVLEVRSGLGPRVSELLSLHPRGEEVNEAALLSRLGKYGEGRWIRLSGTDVLVWEADNDFAWSTGRMFYLKDAKPTSLPGLSTTAGDLIATQVELPYLFLATGTGREVKVYDLRSHTQVFSAMDSWAATFWPRPRRPKIS